MSPWLLTLVIVVVGLTLVAAVLVVPFLMDLNRHRKSKLADPRDSEGAG